MSLNISSNLVPQVVNNYNAYTGDDKMIGLADEVTLPKIKNKTTTVNGMGIGGDVDSPVPGQFESMEATLTWNTLYSYATKMLHPGRSVQITLRAAMQNEDKDGGYTYKGLRIVLGGKPERFETMLNNVVNGALKGVKKQTQEAMAKMMQGSGMGDMFGG